MSYQKRVQMMSAATAWFAGKPNTWYSTPQVLKAMDVAENASQWYRTKILKVLALKGVLEVRGSGKMYWRWANQQPAPQPTEQPAPQPTEQPAPQPTEQPGQPGQEHKTIIAKFGGKCRKCGQSYSIGTILRQEKIDGNWRWVHSPNCSSEQPATPATPATEQQLVAVADVELAKKVAELTKKVEELEAARPPQVIELVRPDMPKVELKERSHPILEQALFHINCGDNVMLVGPKGCGKTYLAQQIATLLGLEYGMISLSGGVTESKLFGRSTPDITTGKSVYTPAPFATMFENGGLYLLDEVDAADPNVLLSLNSGLANGVLPLDRPENPVANRHKTFVCMAAANTWGSGADRQYVGRNQQDGAFTERFVQIEMDYDVQLELDLNADLTDMVYQLQAWRKNIVANRLERTISTRQICRAANWVRHGKDLQYVRTMITAGWRKDEITKAGMEV